MDLYQELNNPQSMTGLTQNQQPNNQNDFFSGLLTFTKNFRGNPQQQAMKVIQEKMLNQSQLNSAIQQTNQIYSMLTKR